jgi:hypothetical protein
MIPWWFIGRFAKGTTRAQLLPYALIDFDLIVWNKLKLIPFFGTPYADVFGI